MSLHTVISPGPETESPWHPGLGEQQSEADRLSEQVTAQRPLSHRGQEAVSQHHLTAKAGLASSRDPTASCVGAEPKQVFTDIQYLVPLPLFPSNSYYSFSKLI